MDSRTASFNKQWNNTKERYFEDLSENHFKKWIIGLEYRWKIYIELRGDITEE